MYSNRNEMNEDEREAQDDGILAIQRRMNKHDHTAFHIAPSSPRADDTISAARPTSVPCSWPSPRLSRSGLRMRDCEVLGSVGELGVACASDGDVTGWDGRDLGEGVAARGEPCAWVGDCAGDEKARTGELAGVGWRDLVSSSSGIGDGIGMCEGLYEFDLPRP